VFQCPFEQQQIFVAGQTSLDLRVTRILSLKRVGILSAFWNKMYKNRLAARIVGCPWKRIF
jgi:hypothetical protein